jgi:hypothetical protein
MALNPLRAIDCDNPMHDDKLGKMLNHIIQCQLRGYMNHDPALKGQKAFLTPIILREELAKHRQHQNKGRRPTLSCSEALFLRDAIVRIVPC